ncbi:MAG: hypothetical protein PGN19_07530 [Pseudomonas oryzihabitans]
MITRMPSATALPLAYDVCPLGVNVPSLSIEMLRRGFLALDHHEQLDVGRAIKRELRERLVAELHGAPPLAAARVENDAALAPYEEPARRSGHQSR